MMTQEECMIDPCMGSTMDIEREGWEDGVEGKGAIL